MKVNRNGQSKILTPQERQLLLNQGFLCQRDRALNELCYYTACRISEARQARYTDIFDGDKVRDTIVIRKCITKGQQATRCIPTHPNLAQSLEKYIQDSRKLLKIKQIIGQWDYKSLYCGQVFDNEQRIICPKCASYDITTAGMVRDKQMYKCKSCLYRFQIKTAFVDHPELRDTVIRLGVYNSMSYGFLFMYPKNPYLFPGAEGKECLALNTAIGIFMKGCRRVNLVGASTHSWRRTALTEMHKAGVPIRVTQNISGHSRVSNLQKYLEVSREEVEEAVFLLP
ncbi:MULTISPECIES: site-specific integrase [Cyanophyceae]|uniref:site-specific integrase n=1 Tax=Cyanophyceae TaxID=3028117 RepID=UPI001684AD0C|nr:site-specific integrase [Trichocoleus sp. FACHB-69]MBD1932570.1 tyrosine-type recombinase/integrase [Trichocoleus sp. FACHB-69]